MITQLKEEGIVISNPKFGSTKSKGANKPRYLIDGEKAEANFVGQGILHPIAMIQHLVCTPFTTSASDAENVAVRQRAN